MASGTSEGTMAESASNRKGKAPQTSSDEASVPFTIPNPEKDPIKLAIMQSQLFIPLNYGECKHVILGPFNPLRL